VAKAFRYVAQIRECCGGEEWVAEVWRADAPEEVWDSGPYYGEEAQEQAAAALETLLTTCLDTGILCDAPHREEV